MKDNPLKKIGLLGQSIWLDYIRKDLFKSGELRRLIEEDGVRGITSYEEIFESKQFAKLLHQGAEPQRLLWASTGTKNHDYSDIKYIEAIIGKNTINTIPPETLDAYRKHGKPALRLKNHIKRACWVMSELTEMGIDIDSITKKLENEGVVKFIKASDKLMETLTKKSLEK